MSDGRQLDHQDLKLVLEGPYPPAPRPRRRRSGIEDLLAYTLQTMALGTFLKAFCEPWSATLARRIDARLVELREDEERLQAARAVLMACPAGLMKSAGISGPEQAH